MTKGKNYNSIVFLTTLSVYLGLVLAGGAGAPQVLAQAALTRNFDVQIEAEIKDDLDKKPDDEIKNLSDSIDDYFVDLKDFFDDLQKLAQIEKFDLNSDIFSVEQANLLPCVEGTKVGPSDYKFIAARWLRPALEDFSNQLGNHYSLADCLLNKRFKDTKVTDSRLKIDYDGSEIKIEIAVKKESSQKAHKLLDNLNRAYKLYELDEEEVIVRKIYENTTFSSENNQVFIVTRLPRGSIDSLLAAKNAQQ